MLFLQDVHFKIITAYLAKRWTCEFRISIDIEKKKRVVCMGICKYKHGQI
jgi:hypothetical protein